MSPGRSPSGELAEIAQEIRSGSLGIVFGCRLLVRTAAARSGDPRYAALLDLIFHIEDETEIFPGENLRSAWEPAALARLDEEMTAYEAKFRDDVFAICDALIREHGETCSEKRETRISASEL